MIDRTRELLIRGQATPFSYDHENKMFRSGRKTFTPEKLPLEFGDLLDDDQPTEVPDVPLVETILRPVMLPRMYDWLNDHFSDDVADETAEVMRQVFVQLRPDMSEHIKPGRDHVGGIFGFNVQRLRHEHPHLTLVTLGSCACFGVDVDGPFGERVWNERIASFSFHNIDTPEQEISLRAGLGHIAYRASQDG